MFGALIGKDKLNLFLILSYLLFVIFILSFWWVSISIHQSSVYLQFPKSSFDYHLILFQNHVSIFFFHNFYLLLRSSSFYFFFFLFSILCLFSYLLLRFHICVSIPNLLLITPPLNLISSLLFYLLFFVYFIIDFLAMHNFMFLINSILFINSDLLFWFLLPLMIYRLEISFCLLGESFFLLSINNMKINIFF